MNARALTITRTALFAALISISAYLRIPTPTVPLTLQPAAVLIAGYALGPKYGPIATIMYTLVGLAGIPVFAYGGGPAYVLSPTFGYILGFTLCAWITGLLARLNPRGSVLKAFLIMLPGLIGIYLPGIAWLVIAMHWMAAVPTSVIMLFKIGVLLPLPGNIITAVPAAAVAVAVRKRISPTE